jgi:hypothetical protein
MSLKMLYSIHNCRSLSDGHPSHPVFKSTSKYLKRQPWTINHILLMRNPTPRHGYVFPSGGTKLYLYFGTKWRCVFSSTPEGMRPTHLWTRQKGPRGREKILIPIGIELRLSIPSLGPHTYFRPSKVTRQMTTHKMPCAEYETAIALWSWCVCSF